MPTEHADGAHARVAAEGRAGDDRRQLIKRGYAHTGMGMDMCMDMCIDIYMDMCIDMCVGMCMDMCTDMCYTE